MRILVADDHTILREGIINSLLHYFPNTDFEQAGDAAGILKILKNKFIDIALLDINLPGRNGLEILKDLKILYPDLPVIVLSMYPEDQFAVRTIRAGAFTYLTKNIPIEQLANAIQSALNKRPYFTTPVVELLATEVREKNQADVQKELSDREFQVLRKIASGKSLTSIGTELSLSVKTISVYRSRILLKLGLKNNTEMINFAFRNNLIDLRDI